MKRFLVLLAVLAALSARADDFIWTSSNARITLEPDGSLSVVETATVFLRDGAKEIERWYWTDADEKVQTPRVVEIQPDGRQIEQRLLSHSSFIRWKPLLTSMPQHTYRIESRVTGAVRPAWAICCAARQHGIFTSPVDRIRQTIAMWRDVAPHHYLLDYEFLFPEQQEGFAFEPSIAFGPEWKPVGAIGAGSIGEVVSEPKGLRIRHVFAYIGHGEPAAVDVNAALLRIVSIVAFPILALVIWLAYLRRYIARPNMATLDERWLSEHLLTEDAEVVAARWSGSPGVLNIETFLRRLERQGKAAIDIGEESVGVRLKVPRDQLSEFDRMVIDELIPDGRSTIDSRDLPRGKNFDPMAKAQQFLYALARQNRSYQRTAVASRAMSFVLFITGFALVVYDSVKRDPDPVVMLSPWLLAILTAVWPSRLIWPRIRRRRFASLALLVPLLVFWAVIVLLETAFADPPGFFGSIGIVLAAIGAYHAIVADAAKSGGSTAARIIELATAEAWFRGQLRLQHPIRKEWQPYIAAFGLTEEPEREDEDWGWAFTVRE
ncbi:MAG TPA: hypothetical protein VJ853_10455 [Thermoanaerobaculia bacterium]|nr:hypothetical protein [Thermoanaerobaculia bacterium]